jgi:mRNA interferase MazF
MLVWAWLDPSVGKEQAGRRPALVVANDEFLDAATDLVMVMPVTSAGRGWANHVAVRPATLLPQLSWVMTEQVRTISRGRIAKAIGQADPACLAEALRWLNDFTRT